MSAAKKDPRVLEHLYGDQRRPSKNLEKREVEVLIQRINTLLATDPAKARQAALIIELWMRHKK